MHVSEAERGQHTNRADGEIRSSAIPTTLAVWGLQHHTVDTNVIKSTFSYDPLEQLTLLRGPFKCYVTQ